MNIEIIKNDFDWRVKAKNFSKISLRDFEKNLKEKGFQRNKIVEKRMNELAWRGMKKLFKEKYSNPLVCWIKIIEQKFSEIKTPVISKIYIKGKIDLNFSYDEKTKILALGCSKELTKKKIINLLKNY